MKRILILFLFTGSSVFAQEDVPIDTVQMACTYWYEFQQDSTSLYSVKGQEMTLLIGRRCSDFASTNSLFSDSIMRAHEHEPSTQATFDKIWAQTDSRLTHSYCKYHIHKNYPEKGTITFTTYLGGGKYFKVAETNHLSWNIINGPDTLLLGYKCQKAVTRYGGRDYVAWFTMDIPIGEGPYKFCGLPGLIVKISDSRNQHRFELVSVNNPAWEQPVYFEKKSNYIDATPPEYVDALNTRMGELFNKIQHQENMTISDDEAKAKALRNVKTRNNFIERY